MPIDRIDICRRHRLDPALAPELHGTTPEALEADAAARAAVLAITKASARTLPRAVERARPSSNFPDHETRDR